MEYIKEIFTLVAWPILIYVSYRLSLIAIKKLDKRIEKHS